jgi:hypothetical protein
LKRSTFKPKLPPPRPAKQMDGYTIKPRAPAVAMVGPARACVPIPKPEKARPGKRTPTVEERAWMDFITSVGCIACLLDGHPGVPGAVHHILRGGRRIGHLHTINLCQPGHHMDGQQRGMVSRHPFKARFEARYGTEAELLARMQAMRAKRSSGIVITRVWLEEANNLFGTGES